MAWPRILLLPQPKHSIGQRRKVSENVETHRNVQMSPAARAPIGPEHATSASVWLSFHQFSSSSWARIKAGQPPTCELFPATFCMSRQAAKCCSRSPRERRGAPKGAQFPLQPAASGAHIKVATRPGGDVDEDIHLAAD